MKDIILALTANKDNLIKISRDYQDFTNTVSGMQEAATDASFASEFLGGRTPTSTLPLLPKTSRSRRCPPMTRAAWS